MACIHAPLVNDVIADVWSFFNL